MTLLALFTLPATLDVLRNPNSGLNLNDTALRWHSGKRRGRIDLHEIARIRMDTRLDLSIKVTVILENGVKIRLPFEATPPHLSFEAALHDRGVKTERFHFQLMQ